VVVELGVETTCKSSDLKAKSGMGIGAINGFEDWKLTFAKA
jgi:hypothetical protein